MVFSLPIDALLEKLLRGRKQDRLMKWTRQNWRTRIQIRKDGAMTMEKDMRMVNVILGQESLSDS